jgi:FAD:protein FMN transferase
MLKKVSIIAILIALCGVGYSLYLHRENATIRKRSRFLFDTLCSIHVPGGKNVLPAIDKAFERAEEIDKKFNVLNPESLLYDFNHKNTPVTDPEIVAVIEKALEISKKSDGKFDITVFPLVDIWGFHRALSGELVEPPHDVPKASAIKETLGKVGYRYLGIKNGTLTKKHSDVMIDLGGIAKGYAVQEAAKVLKDLGIRSALVDFGGNIYVIGKIKERPWKIAVKNPFGEGIVGIVEMSDKGISTSGNYERFFEKDGVRYCHIIDPATGYPARGLSSVTVIYPDNTIPDGWSTTLFILGKEKGNKLPEKETYGEAIYITEKGEISYTLGLEGKFKILDKYKTK